MRHPVGQAFAFRLLRSTGLYTIYDELGDWRMFFARVPHF